MESPFALKNHEKDAKSTRRFFGTALFVFALLCMVSACMVAAQGQDLTATVPNDHSPHALTQQLRQIAESSAEEVQPLQKTCIAILNDLDKIIHQLEHNPGGPSPALERLEQAVETWSMLQKTWTRKVSVHGDERSYIPSAATLEEISQALQRRISVWKLLLKTGHVEPTPITTLYPKTQDDLDRLKEQTLAVERHFTAPRRGAAQMGQTWCVYLEMQSWLLELEASQKSLAQPIRRVSLDASEIPVEVLKTLSHRANTTLHRLESPTLTEEQRAFLSHPTVHTWQEELQLWSTDLVDPLSAVRLLEQYETTGGATDMVALAKFLDQLSVSKTAEYRQLGEHIRRQYGMANLRFFISSALLSNHLPDAEKKIASFREVIQDQPTVGWQQTDTELAVSLVAHPTRLLAALNVWVNLATYSRSDAMGTQLFSTGRASVIARKTIELTEQGFRAGPCEVDIVDHRMRLVGVKTDFDRVPLVSGMFRNAVFDQYESRRSDANMETRRKILRQVRSQVDRQVEKRLLQINEKIGEVSRYIDEEFGLQVDSRNSQTEENWLIASWGVHHRHALMGNTSPPSTLPGSFADLKIHESLPNMMIGQFEFDGKQGTIGEFKEILAKKLKQPSLAVAEENDDVEIAFAPYNPVVVRFQDGRMELTISIAALRLNRQTHRDFQVVVWYKPAYDSEGQLVLERDGVISLVNVQAQILLRAAFGKIFPADRPFPLVPKMLEDDPQFDYLSVGHCRIENGWFALALIEKGKE